jgi:tRNA dimethylallyltransferase
MSTKNNLKNNNILIVILGPTAIGKTDFAIKLAKQVNGEIISADSRTVYQQMNIGTAKPSSSQRKLIPHYLLDVRRPDQIFTVAEFKKQALRIIQDIQSHGKIPFLVGGTGLYISAIVNNLSVPQIAPDKKLRKKLEVYIKKYGLKKLYAKLIKLDPEAKEFIDPKNPRRIIRAIEVYLKTKQKFSQLRQSGQPLFRTLQIGLNLPRHKLYEKINNRTDQMIKSGLIKETQGLMKKYSPNLPSMSGIGYKQISLYLKNKISLPIAIELIKRDTRRYAKRQLTWFKRDKNIRWLVSDDAARAKKIIKNFIKREINK